MSFAPVIPAGGLVGWRFLEQTEAAQRETFAKGPEITRDLAYFRENIGAVTTAEELVTDRRLLKVALGAFGMGEEIEKRAFLRRILEEGTLDPEAFANRFVDPRYREFAAGFGFGNGVPETLFPDFADRIADRYTVRAFEAAVGESDTTMRLALNFRREIGEIAASPGNAETRWLKIFGSTPMRDVMLTALGIPQETSGLDIDKQVEVLTDRARDIFGAADPAELAQRETVDFVLRRFLTLGAATASVASASGSPAGATALALLGGAAGGGGSAGIANLLLSRG
ncbi:MAG: DUF1217 domain-containing protein [Pseudomonadota bacterium]